MSSQLRKSLLTLAAILLTAAQAQPQASKPASYKEKVLHAFTGKSDGSWPQALLRDANGNFYGSTAFGGSLVGQCGQGLFSNGCGVLFKISAERKFSVLHTFHFRDGAWPTNLIRDSKGNLYGISQNGKSDCGCGMIFKFTPEKHLRLLYTFTDGSDGANPSGLIMDDHGNLYGTADNGAYGWGNVFKLTPAGDFTVLYSFTGRDDGGVPRGLVVDHQGNLYIPNSQGGAYGVGTVFKLDRGGKGTVLYAFQGGSDGAVPEFPLVMDETGNLFGTTTAAGYKKGECYNPPFIDGCGTVFKVSTAGVFSVLFPFHYLDGDNGATLMVNAVGAVYGMAPFGGDSCRGCGGVAFKITPNGRESVLHKFKGGRGGSLPGSFVEDSTGNLYGTTYYGGDLSCPYPSPGLGCGVVFELTP